MAVNVEFRFDDQLLNHIKFHRNNEAKMMLSEVLAKKSDGSGTLLHRAAYYDNAEIVKRLIDLGSDVNFSGPDGQTPLMVAVKHERLASVKVLLDAGVNVDIVDAEGQSALQMVFHSDYVNTAIIEEFVYKIKAHKAFEGANYVAKKLVAAGCAPHHAIILKNAQIIQFMLQIVCEGLYQKRNPHAAVKQDPALVFVCLELDCNLDNENYERYRMILNFSLSNKSAGDQEKIYDFVDYLSEIGELTAFDNLADYTLHRDDDWLESASNAIHTFIAHLVMLKKLGTSIVKTAKCFDVEWYEKEMSKFEKYHELCEQMLDAPMLENSTLFDLVTDQDEKMRKYARNETFESIVDSACSKYKLRELFPYYFKMLKIRISRAKQTVELEEKAKTGISKMFNSSYSHCYLVARKIVGYLNKRDLEWLCIVYD